MREVILTVGTRAAGKSTFCEKATALDPSIVEISRDKILVSLFGRTSLSPYTGEHHHAFVKMWKAVESALESGNVRMILDTWNGSSTERRFILNKLRGIGASRVVAWYFTTPVKTVEEWFWLKPGIAKASNRKRGDDSAVSYYSDDAPRRDHDLFQRLASDIDSDGFDEVIRINPLTTDPEHILRLQTSLKF